MHVYFSHSYRDVAINTYFMGHLIQQNIPLVADQKSKTWCVAKLERYLFQVGSFISIIPKRPSDQDPAGYSPYIAHEIDLARRARTPRLLFVEQQVFRTHETRFPEDTVVFDAAEPQREAKTHRTAIQRFLEKSQSAEPPLHDLRRNDEAVLVAENLSSLRGVVDDLAELLRREKFSVTRVTPGKQAGALDNVRLLENLWRSELCVFVLGERLSDTHLALAMAHAHCIPAIRLQYDKHSTQCAPTLQGEIRWSNSSDMLMEFRDQLTSFRRGFVEPVALAQDTSVKEAMASLGTTDWQPQENELWALADGPALLRHVRTNAKLVQDQANSARRTITADGADNAGREREFALCTALYDGIKQFKFAYETEAQVGTATGVQKIRPPLLIAQSQAATCIDLACLFAALLEAAGLNPIVLVLRTSILTHALVGYRCQDEPAWPAPGLGDVRRAVNQTDAVFFEATGAVEADAPVIPEEIGARQDKVLPFLSARASAERFLQRQDVALVHIIDVRHLRGA
jgi:hypothetical protein